ncbi:unnamed protein product [Miscanthus lutarioriparius]|uniref:Complex III subunit VI n=1 Tax=Miscanthus lutarioriparius TaxID=422564 RepID=A0A811Q474_9POAL|nr:unnamed protein product [Miscanthus lutarioriparius]
MAFPELAAPSHGARPSPTGPLPLQPTRGSRSFLRPLLPRAHHISPISPPPPNSPFSSRSVGLGSSSARRSSSVAHNSIYVRIVKKADEEVTDPKALLEERSKAKCVSQWYEYQKCVKRIENDETGHKHCTGQYFDYWKCVDKNVAEKLFEMLK